MSFALVGVGAGVTLAVRKFFFWATHPLHADVRAGYSTAAFFVIGLFTLTVIACAWLSRKWRPLGALAAGAALAGAAFGLRALVAELLITSG